MTLRNFFVIFRKMVFKHLNRKYLVGTNIRQNSSPTFFEESIARVAQGQNLNKSMIYRWQENSDILFINEAQVLPRIAEALRML